MEFSDLNNDPIFEKLNSELNKFKSKAPNGVWENIAQNLDNDEIDRQIKDAAFDANAVAPSGLWFEISESIDNKIKSDEILDEKIKESYLQKSKAPQSIWYSIEQQLNIDEVWAKIQPELDKIRLTYFRKKILNLLSVAALLLLFVKTCNFDFFPENKNMVNQINLYNSSEIKETLRTEKFNILNPKNLTNEKKSEIVNNASDNTRTNKFDSIKFNSGLLNKISHKTASIIADDVIFSFNENSKSNTKPLELVLSNTSIETKKNIKTNLRDTPLIILNYPSSKYVTEKPLRYELGINGFINKTQLINDQNTKRLSLVSNNVVKSESNPSFSYGLAMAVNFNKKHSLVLELWHKANISYEYHYLHNGRNYYQLVDFNYQNINVLYRYKFISFDKSKRNNMLLTSGFYLSNLKSVSHAVNQLPGHLINGLPKVNQWDGGFSNTLSMQHDINNLLLIEYGIRNEIGAGSIFDFGKGLKTNIMNNGLFISLRYTWFK